MRRQDEVSRVNVVCRVRPLTPAEESARNKFIIKFPFKYENSLALGESLYFFDRVFLPHDSQEKVYSLSVKSVVTSVLRGYNATVLAYGQTSSGKTYTMEGSVGDMDKQGIIPRAIYDIFYHIYTSEDETEFTVKVSYVEIHLEHIRDLLDLNKGNLAIHENINKIPYIKNATEKIVNGPKDVLLLLQEGKVNKHFAMTNMNEKSSRSHAILLINVKQENITTGAALSGNLYLVDLAGSEQLDKIDAQGITLKEAKHINKSLSTLSHVILNLSEGKNNHIPYRDSKLTRLLQQSLGGNSRTTIILCCSPARSCETEIKRTLEFGKTAKSIKNFLKVNEDVAPKSTKDYSEAKKKVKFLESKIKEVENEIRLWREGHRVDTENQVDLDGLKDVLGLQSSEAVLKQSSRPTSRCSEASVEGLRVKINLREDEIAEQMKTIRHLEEEIRERHTTIKKMTAMYSQALSKITAHNKAKIKTNQDCPEKKSSAKKCSKKSSDKKLIEDKEEPHNHKGSLNRKTKLPKFHS